MLVERRALCYNVVHYYNTNKRNEEYLFRRHGFDLFFCCLVVIISIKIYFWRKAYSKSSFYRPYERGQMFG